MKGANLNCKDCYYELGTLYMLGLGRPKDTKIAENCYKKVNFFSNLNMVVSKIDY